MSDVPYSAYCSYKAEELSTGGSLEAIDAYIGNYDPSVVSSRCSSVSSYE